MNISGKYLKDQSLSSKKISFYQKLPSRYKKAYKIYSTKNNKNTNAGYKNKVLKWFFSFNLEDRKNICSVENKLFTKILHEMYLKHKGNERSLLKFRIIEDKETFQQEQEQINKRNDSSQYCSGKMYFNNDDNYNNSEEIINEVKFYQCEAPINNCNSKSSYFTLSNRILTDQELFIHYFEKISGNQCFTCPIKTGREEGSKNSNFQFPDWINPEKYYSLSEHLVGLFEQSISIKYILSLNGKDVTEEILNVYYLKDLMRLQQDLEKFIKQYSFNKLYDEFKLFEIIDNIYDSNKPDDYLEYETKMPTGWMVNPNVFSLQNTKEDVYKNFQRKIVEFNEIDNSYSEFSNYLTFIPFTQLFRKENLLCRKIFERILERYQEKEVNSLDTEKEHSKKKKKKKKKKKVETNDTNSNVNISTNVIDELGTINIIKMIIEDIFNMSWKIINNNINNNNLKQQHNNNNFIEDNLDKNNKKHKKVKEKKFFLYNTVKTTKTKEHQNNNQENKGKYIDKNKINSNKNQNIIISLNKQSLSPDTTRHNFKNTSHNNSVLSNTQASDQDEQQLNNINSSSEMNHNFNDNLKSKYNLTYSNKIPKRQPMLISSTTSSITISSCSNQHSNLNSFNLINTKPNLGNEIILIQNPTNSLTDNLNRDMELFLQEEEQFLKLLREAKLIIREYLFQITSKIYPESILQIYGSSLFELDIESSDLDLSITTFMNQSLDLLSIHLTSSPLYSTLFDKITPVLSASVPVIKLEIDPLKLNLPLLKTIYSQIYSTSYYKSYIFDKKEIDLVRVDITLNSINFNQIKFTNHILSMFSDMIPVIKIMKRLLQLKKLNLTYKGGMSSYCLLILVYACTKVSLYSRSNRGMLFIEFLTRIGMLVDFQHTIINPNRSNPFLTYSNIDSIPSILDPVTNNNLGKSLFKIFDIVALIKKVHETLFEINKTIDIINNKSYINGKPTNIIKELFKKFVEN